MASPDYDIAIVGGGPAGAAAALTLTRVGLRVVLAERSTYERPRVGETLPPGARPLLARLGLADAVVELGSTPSYGNQSAWGAEDVWSSPFVFGPHGNGWHVDRAGFDQAVVDAAVAAGTELLEGNRVTACTSEQGGPWHLTLERGEELTANGLLDATGRRGALARTLGARRQFIDHLVGIATRYSGPAHDAGYTLVEAGPDGWWYSAPIPPNQTMVMFMTDADLCRRTHLDDPKIWLRRLADAPETALRIVGYEALGPPKVSSAASHRLKRNGYSERWLAAGDAAIGVDPLSSSGIHRALLTGEAAGYALAHWLLGHVDAARDYEHWLDAQFDEYQRERTAYYALETRWPESQFWRRRQEDETARTTESPITIHRLASSRRT
jgi:flavin-dependent dehydrogenase